ncbi:MULTISPECIES: YicC/YloC family endoribonuclease [unclassified Leeuwenhoekiella]|uniref:YicC/YloC family endoribonuclease n=1 Tax=unclassified Leeuwenhoekiella TaxID=2615029 RepID=UPI000C6100BE|nr:MULTISPECIES: YicC/YloC family endoribonuclease [unclassified Leeuwenhoekiella]MAW95854.1 YicC family protein [Leeuwenhoekiella sp.]MBA82875.1 YicC family protein [Leeuwenhoekiella sp.]|tara:strand:- start:14347 stop:15207 length:861 start_codon:yes stop_codon:yes gene_type:complete
MIKSMTGFGKSVTQLPSKKITIEIKSLNSKNQDLNARIPSFYREKELELRNLIAQRLQRGKIDFSLYVELNGEETSTAINADVVKQYIKQLREVTPDADAVELLKMAIRLPDALKTEKDEIDEAEYQAILKGVEEALESIDKYRADEGQVLKEDFELRISNISKYLDEVKKIDPERMEGVRERLNKAVADLKTTVDENRFEQELTYYLEKYDITEEKVRLRNHLEYFSKTLNSSDSNGKKLAFISQEMGREINTIGSKSNYAPMQQVVVRMKDELEKIKEQLLNVL